MIKLDNFKRRNILKIHRVKNKNKNNNIRNNSTVKKIK